VHPTAVQIIRDEHLAIAAVLYSLRFLVRRMQAETDAPNFPLLHAMLDYIVEYPDRWHHPKESEFLFKTLRERDPSTADLVDELEREHQDGDLRIVDLKHRLAALERGDPQALPSFSQAVEAYAEAQWKHIRKEEDVLMPLAERSLNASDWRRVAQAFQQNDNPLFGIKPKDEAERLYQKILSLAPPPIGQARLSGALHDHGG
jgi:hemerythrin-like domain-containing protein